MKNYIKTIIILLLLSISAKAQKNSITAGGDATGSNGKLSYSIGQVDYIVASGFSGAYIIQGVQQPYEIFQLDTEPFLENNLKVIIYPNPTTSIVNLKIENHNLENLSFAITNELGQTVLNQKILNNNTQINIEKLSEALYFLQIIENDKTIKTFKIVKK